MFSIHKTRLNPFDSLPVAFLAAVLTFAAFVATGRAGSGSSYTMMVGNFTVLVANSIIQINGTAGPDVIHIAQDANGQIWLLNPFTNVYVLIGIKPAQVQVICYQGDDFCQLDVTAPTLCRGGPGSDVIIGGLGSSLSQIYGDLDNDSLTCRGNTQAWGGPGSDNFTLGSPWMTKPETIAIYGDEIDADGNVVWTFEGYRDVNVPVFSVIEDFTMSDHDSKNDPSNPGWKQQTIH